MSKWNERGFTFPELLVTTGIIVVLLAISVFLLAPTKFDNQNLQAERQIRVAGIAQGINRYVASTGQLPANIPSKATTIGSPSGQYNICTYLVPTYVNDIPLDPVMGLKTKLNTDKSIDPPCSEKGVSYTTGFTIYMQHDGSIVVSAPAAAKAFAITIRPIAK